MIRLVLQTLPVYYMATVKIPSGVIKTITALIRKFFWGKMDKSRYLAYVAWEEITNPIHMGGLGLRNLELTNEALLMKSLWKIASGNEAQWVNIVIAKYIPRSNLWQSKREYKCSAFWCGIMKLKHKLLPLLMWQLGNGEICDAVRQPWFLGSAAQVLQTQPQGHLKVANLVNLEQGTWDTDKLIQLFGMTVCMGILSTVKPPTNCNREDTLRFTLTTNGEFSEKKAYCFLKGNTDTATGAQYKPLWKGIWKKGKIAPRLRVFLWKLANDALPLAATLFRRMAKGDPYCGMGGVGDEDPIHMMFQCTFSRACWFTSQFPVQSDELTGTIKDILKHLITHTDNEQWSVCVSTLWVIWQSRNDVAYSGKTANLENFSLYYSKIAAENMLISCEAVKATPEQQSVNTRQPATIYETDRSWTHHWQAGLGFVFFNEQGLIAYRAASVAACCPLQAEACALQQAIKFALQQGFSDCEGLANLCMRLQPPTDGDWRAFSEMFEVWKMVKCSPGFSCEYMPRRQNGMADHLAKTGRLLGEEYTGYTYPTFKF